MVRVPKNVARYPRLEILLSTVLNTVKQCFGTAGRLTLLVSVLKFYLIRMRPLSFKLGGRKETGVPPKSSISQKKIQSINKRGILSTTFQEEESKMQPVYNKADTGAAL